MKTGMVVSLSAVALGLTLTAARAEPVVVTSIKPVHSLAAAVMKGIGEPELIVTGASSPHHHALKPSQARMLEKADVVFWVGPDLETFLKKPLTTISEGAQTLALIEAKGVQTYKFRDEAEFEHHDEHNDEDHGHDDHAEHDEHHDEGHGHDEHDEHHDEGHGHDDHAEHDEHHDEGHGHDDHAEHDDHTGHDDHAEHEEHHDDGHDDHAGHDDHGHHHDHDGLDPHIWLDPVNAKAMAHAIADTLSKVDAANADAYHANADRISKQLDALTADVAHQLEAVKEKRFMAFHDAYQYFEKRFDLHSAGAIVVSPETMPGADRVSRIKKRIIEQNAVCVFSEPQFDPKLVDVVTEGAGVSTGVIDPLGATISDGPELYEALIRAIADEVQSCLTGTG